MKFIHNNCTRIFEKIKSCLCTNRNQDQSLYNTHDLPRVTSLFAPRIQQQPPFFLNFNIMHYFCRSMNRAERDETPRIFSERDRIVNDQEHPPPPPVSKFPGSAYCFAMNNKTLYKWRGW